MSDKVAKITQQFDLKVDQVLKIATKTQFIKGLVQLLLALYAVRLAPELPASVLELFLNPYVKLIVFSLILWTAQFSPSTAIMISLAFMVTVNYATNKPLWEFLTNEEENKEEQPQQPQQPEQPQQPQRQEQMEVVGAAEESPLAKLQTPTPALTVNAQETEEAPLPVGCYPIRSYDMTKVSGYDTADL